MSHIDESRISAYVDGDPSVSEEERAEIDSHIVGKEAGQSMEERSQCIIPRSVAMPCQSKR